MQSDFNSQLASAGAKLVVVDFYATWCGPCKMIAPKIESMSQELMDSVVFLKVDVDKNEVKRYKRLFNPINKIIQMYRISPRSIK